MLEIESYVRDRKIKERFRCLKWIQFILLSIELSCDALLLALKRYDNDPHNQVNNREKVSLSIIAYS